MRSFNIIVVCNRHMRRKVERYQQKHPKLTFTQAYNKIYGTSFDEPPIDENTEFPKTVDLETESPISNNSKQP